jgi:putative Holliday junction resolvase
MLPSGRRLAIDYGEVRIGLAMSDPTGTLSSPLMTLRNEVSNPDGTFQAISEVVDANEIRVIYIGLPLHLSGEEGASSEKVRIFAAGLRTHVSLQMPIQLLDERLSTKAAINQANAMGKKLGRDEVDQMAAVAILEFALSVEKSIGNFAGNAI